MFACSKSWFMCTCSAARLGCAGQDAHIKNTTLVDGAVWLFQSQHAKLQPMHPAKLGCSQWHKGQLLFEVLINVVGIIMPVENSNRLFCLLVYNPMPPQPQLRS